MKIPSFLDPLAPFKGYLIAGALLLLLAGLAYAGKQVYDKGHANGEAKQQVADAKVIASLNSQLAEKKAKLRDAAVALRAAAGAIRAVNAEADARIAQAQLDKTHAQTAEAIAKRAADRLRADARAAAARLDRARGTSLDCQKLLDLDVDAELSRLGCPLN